MNLSSLLERRFTPKAWAEAGEPVVFVLRALTVEQRDRLTSVRSSAAEPLVPDLRGFFLAGVARIENLTVDGKAVTTAEEFMQLPGLYPIYLAVAVECFMFNGLGGAERKN